MSKDSCYHLVPPSGCSGSPFQKASSIFPQRSVRGFVPVTVTQALLSTGRTYWATKSRVGVEAGPPPCSLHPARETQLQPGSRRIPEAPRASGPGHRPASRSPTLTSAATGPGRDRKCVTRPRLSLSRSSFSPSRWCPRPRPLRLKPVLGSFAPFVPLLNR